MISYHYGAAHYEELGKLYHVALKTIAVMSVVTFIFAAAFLRMGFSLFASGFFTALNDGITSAVLSLFRTLIFLMLPLLGGEGLRCVPRRLTAKFLFISILAKSRRLCISLGEAVWVLRHRIGDPSLLRHKPRVRCDFVLQRTLGLFFQKQQCSLSNQQHKSQHSGVGLSGKS